VQHGSDKILMAMKRGYTCLEYKSLIRKIRQAKPNIPISSDFIVGFPGETDADFQELMDLVHHVQFDNSYCFSDLDSYYICHNNHNNNIAYIMNYSGKKPYRNEYELFIIK
jgi:coproporphyrinogen III oxidase-like Fe-S oxidoreductase